VQYRVAIWKTVAVVVEIPILVYCPMPILAVSLAYFGRRFGPRDIELLLTLADADSICSAIVRTQTPGHEESYFRRVIFTVLKYK
jgi:hypothetical protein